MNKAVPKITILLILAAILWIVSLSLDLSINPNVLNTEKRTDSETVSINNVDINVELAITTEMQIKGLCCREFLAENDGMLFVYETEANRRFWMKDTLIPLDMIFINSDREIVKIHSNVQPSSFPQTFGGGNTTQYVLEVNGGFSTEKGIKEGDVVEIDFI